MNTESSYIYSGSHEEEGLGRIPRLTLNRNLPTIHKPTVPSRSIIKPKRITLPKPTIKPRALPKLRPLIDKKPLPPPARIKFIPKKTSTNKRSKSNKKAPSTKKTTSHASAQKPVKPAGKSGGMLDGTLNLGGLEIEKKHAAVAGGTAVGGLLLWKLLF